MGSDGELARRPNGARRRSGDGTRGQPRSSDLQADRGHRRTGRPDRTAPQDRNQQIAGPEPTPDGPHGPPASLGRPDPCGAKSETYGGDRPAVERGARTPGIRPRARAVGICTTRSEASRMLGPVRDDDPCDPRPADHRDRRQDHCRTTRRPTRYPRRGTRSIRIGPDLPTPGHVRGGHSGRHRPDQIAHRSTPHDCRGCARRFRFLGSRPGPAADRATRNRRLDRPIRRSSLRGTRRLPGIGHRAARGSRPPYVHRTTEHARARGALAALATLALGRRYSPLVVAAAEPESRAEPSTTSRWFRTRA